MTNRTPGPWPITRQYAAPHTYCPKIIVGPAVINFIQGYHTAEEDAARKARAEADALAVSEVPVMLDLLGEAQMALDTLCHALADMGLAELAAGGAGVRDDIRALLARVGGEG